MTWVYQEYQEPHELTAPLPGDWCEGTMLQYQESLKLTATYQETCVSAPCYMLHYQDPHELAAPYHETGVSGRLPH